MEKRLTRVAVTLAWLALPAGAAHTQTSSVQPVYKLPAKSLELQVDPQSKPTTEAGSKPNGPVMTHGFSIEPGNAPPDDLPQEAIADDDDKGQEPSVDDTDETTVDRKPSTSHDSGPAIGTRIPGAPHEPGARDFARYDRGSFLTRPPTGFSPLRKHAQASPGMELDADAAFEPCELLVPSPNMPEAQRVNDELAALSIDIKRRFTLPNLGMVLSAFCAPDSANTEKTLDTLTRRYPSLTVTLNHRYVPAAERNYYATAMGWQDELYLCSTNRRIGLVDTGIDVQHRAFATARVTTRNLLSPGTRAADMEHGTATASVLAGASEEAPGLVRAANLAAVSVFRQRSGSDIDTNAELLVRAIDWLLGQHVELINMSLAGPANRLLENALQTATAAGVIVVAAAGNGDRNPVFPAAYPEVVAVTAVDAHARVYAPANRGDYIDFAAPGVDLFLAAPGDRGKYYSGTSFAAPFVTAALAVMKSRDPEADTGALLKQLTNTAVDLGDPDRDPVFGWGLVQAPADCTSLATRE